MFRNKMSRLMLIATVFCITVSFVGLVFAGDNVPLKGSFSGQGPFFEGNFTHLGRFEGEITDVISPTETEAEWTAANGDTVTNMAVFLLGDPIPGESGVFNYTQRVTITGGTGRFANATGSATVEGVIDINTGEYDGYLKGTISRPNSKR